MLKLLSWIRSVLVIAIVFCAVQSSWAAATAGCFRDIRKDTKGTSNPADDVIYDFGCTTADVCGKEGPCSPMGGSIGGFEVFACACEGWDANGTTGCIIAYWDSGDEHSELGDGGGSGGAVLCLQFEPCYEEMHCVYHDTWVDVGDPDVPQKAPDCDCQPD